MDSAHFDQLARSSSAHASRRAALRALAGAVVGAALASFSGLDETEAGKKGKKKKGKGKGKGKQKVTICHNGQTIAVSKSALKAHTKHGETSGECLTRDPARPAPGPTCSALFATCAVNADCCTNICIGVAGPDMCLCAPLGETCTTGANCCSGACTAGTCTCHEAGSICTIDAHCCTGLSCQDTRPVAGLPFGTCQTAPPAP